MTRADPQVAVVEGLLSADEARQIIDCVNAQDAGAWKFSRGRGGDDPDSGRDGAQATGVLTPLRGRHSSWCVVPIGQGCDNALDVSASAAVERDTSASSAVERAVGRAVERAALLTGLSSAHAESVQCVYYQPGGEYQEHTDYFPLRHVTGPRGNRLVSVFVYLNDVAEGGETHFPLLGISVRPRVGQALIWMNIDKRGVLDGRTLHAGCPVVAGEKYGMNIWFRQRPEGQAGGWDGGLARGASGIGSPSATSACAKAQSSSANQERSE